MLDSLCLIYSWVRKCLLSLYGPFSLYGCYVRMTRVPRLNYFFYKQSFLAYCTHMLQYWLSQGCIQMTRHDTLLSKFTPVAESSWPYLSPSLIVTVSYGPWCPAYHLVSAALPQIHCTCSHIARPPKLSHSFYLSKLINIMKIREYI